MWFMDLPMDSLDEPAIYQVADNSSRISSQEEPVHRFGVCELVDESTEIYPVFNAVSLYRDYVDSSFKFNFNKKGEEPETKVVVNLIVGPRNGSLNSTDNEEYKYEPDDPDFYGVDTLVFEVKAEGMSAWIYYLMSVRPGEPRSYISDGGERVPDKTRCPQERWEFAPPSQAPYSESGALEIPGLFFSDLPNSALAQTTGTGTGPNAKITLDTNAAGHGWFIDYTPYLNEEYLPTSSPYEWIDKPGSGASVSWTYLPV